MKPSYWDDATVALARTDKVLRRIIRGHPDVHLRRRTDPFTALARAIVGQQISDKAADKIWGSLLEQSGCASRAAFPRLDTTRVVVLEDAVLREVGLSQSKAAYV